MATTAQVAIFDKTLFESTVQRLKDVGFNETIAMTKATNEVNHFISEVIAKKLENVATQNLPKCYEIIRTVCRAGLTLNPVAKQVYLQTAYGGGLTFSISYLGLCYLAVKGGQIKNITAELVFKNDVFEFDKGAQTLKHIPNFDAPRLVNGGGQTQTFNAENPVIFGYVRIQFADSNVFYADYDRSEIDRLRTFAKQQHVWNTSPIQMAKKGIIRRAMTDFAYLLDYDRNAELFAALESEQNEHTEFETVEPAKLKL